MVSQNQKPILGITLLLSLIGLGISFLIQMVLPGRSVTNPLPVVLSLSQITRGLLYWDWQSPIYHLGFMASLAALAVLLLKGVGVRGSTLSKSAADVSRLTAVLLMGITAVQQIDALIVGFYYLISGFLSILFISKVSEKLASWLR